MTEVERLKAAGVSAVDAAYAAWQATVDSANTARAAYDAVSKAYNAILAAQAKEQTND
jgi:methionine synthase II (cobalamin-independent)